MNTATVAMVVLASVMICACARVGRSTEDQNAQAMRAVREEISRVVTDTARKEDLHATIGRYEEELRTFQRTVLELQDLLHALNADPNASREQFSELIARYQIERRASRARLVQIHHELLALTTAEEWRSIAKREVELLRLADAATTRTRT